MTEGKTMAAAIAVVEIPIIIVMWIVTTAVGAPWWTMPVIIVGAFAVCGWTFLVAWMFTKGEK